MPPVLCAARYFADLPDPRVDRTRKHALTDILVITLAATIAGAESFEAVAAFGRSKRGWLARFLSLANGIPSADTFGRVFARLDPQAFGSCVADWMAAVCDVADRACEADFTGVKHDGAETIDDAHGRHEERYVTVIYDPEGLPPEWPNVAAVVLVGREREVKGKRTDTVHYYITSLRGPPPSWAS